MSLVVVGSLAFDTIETPYGRREKIVGGSSSYFSLAASFFTQPKIVGAVGRDFPKGAIDLFQERGIDLEGLEIFQGKTFFWEGHYGEDPNQRTTIKTEMNVLEGFKPKLPSDYQTADIVFLANIDPDLQEGILRQIKKPKLVGMDTINLWIESKPGPLLKILDKVDILFANDEEMKMLAKEINLIKAGKKLLEKGPSFIVIKKGEHGSLILGKDFIFAVPAYPCEEVVDSTGAGDSFAGGFMGYLDKVKSFSKREIRKAAVYGSIMASFTIEDFGIERLKSLTLSEIEERFLDFKKLVMF